jgi:hypothetical protein
VSYRYRKQVTGQIYAPALPPAVVFKRSVIGSLMVSFLGSLRPLWADLAAVDE